MAITGDVVAELGPLLQAVGRLIRADMEPNESALRTLLLAGGYDPTPTLLGELFHWSVLLRTFKAQPSAAVRDNVAEALARRGLPPALIDAVLDEMRSPATPRGNGVLALAGEDAALPGGLGPEGVIRRGWPRRRSLLAARVYTATRPVLLAIRSGFPLIVLLGLILRVWLATTQSAWNDEAWSLQRMAALPLDALYNTVKYLDTKSLLYYALLHIWITITGFGVVQARLLSVVFGVAAIGVLYALTELLFDRATALCAALLLAISPIAIWYADEIRMYAATSFFALLTVYLLLRAAREQAWRYAWRWWAGYALSAALAVSIDPSGVYLPLAVNAYYVVLLARRQVPLLPWLASGALAVLVALPALLLLRYQMANNIALLNWIPAPTLSIVWASARDVLSLNADSLWSGLAFLPLLLVAGFGVWQDRRAGRGLQVYALLVLLILTPFVVSLVASLVHPVFLTRTILPAVYGVLILFARGVVLLPRTRIPAGAVALAALAGLNATSLYAAAATPLKENWRALAQYVDRNAGAESLIVLDPDWLDDRFNLYWRSYHRRVLLHEHPQITSDLYAADVFHGIRSVWVVAYYQGGSPPVDGGTAFLRAHYRLADITTFQGPNILALYHFVATGPANWVASMQLPDQVSAVPGRVRNSAGTLVQVSTVSGATCSLRIIYDTDHGAIGWSGIAQPADDAGGVAWRVQVLTRARAGTMIAPCTLGRHTVRGTARLYITQ